MSVLIPLHDADGAEIRKSQSPSHLRTKPLSTIQERVLSAVSRAQSFDVIPEVEDDEAMDEPVDITGLEAKTRVTTTFGDVPAHLVRVNDTVRTADGTYRKVTKVDVIQFDREFLDAYPDALPILIGADAIRPGVPRQDIVVAPGTQITSGFGTVIDGPLKARDLLHRPRVRRLRCDHVAYYRFDVGAETSIMTEKTWLAVNGKGSA